MMGGMGYLTTKLGGGGGDYNGKDQNIAPILRNTVTGVYVI